MRPMEIQAAIGLVQLRRLETFLNARDAIVRAIVEQGRAVRWLRVIGSERLARKGVPRAEREHSWMNIPIVLEHGAPLSVREVKLIFEKHGVETRPIIAGDLTQHPASASDNIERRVAASLANSSRILDNGFMIGCHPTMPNTHPVRAAISALSKF